MDERLCGGHEQPLKVRCCQLEGHVLADAFGIGVELRGGPAVDVADGVGVGEDDLLSQGAHGDVVRPVRHGAAQLSAVLHQGAGPEERACGELSYISSESGKSESLHQGLAEDEVRRRNVLHY